MDDNKGHREDDLLFELGSGPISDRDASSYKDAPGLDFEDRHQRPTTSGSEPKVGDRERFEEIFRSMVPPKKK